MLLEYLTTLGEDQIKYKVTIPDFVISLLEKYKLRITTHKCFTFNIAKY